MHHERHLRSRNRNSDRLCGSLLGIHCSDASSAHLSTTCSAIRLRWSCRGHDKSARQRSPWRSVQPGPLFWSVMAGQSDHGRRSGVQRCAGLLHLSPTMQGSIGCRDHIRVLVRRRARVHKMRCGADEHNHASVGIRRWRLRLWMRSCRARRLRLTTLERAEGGVLVTLLMPPRRLERLREPLWSIGTL